MSKSEEEKFSKGRRKFIQASGMAVGLAAMGRTSAFVPASAATGNIASSGVRGVSATPFGIPTPSNPSPGQNITAVSGDRAGNWLPQTRSEVLARHGMVATSQSLAAQEGLRILQDGGNSADAAVATAAVLALVEPGSTGLGADMFVLHYSARDRHLYGLNSSGWSPQGWNLDYFNQKGYTAETGIPAHSVDAITVPGAIEGWHQLLQRFGTMGFSRVLEAPKRLSYEGFGLTERIHSGWQSGEEVLQQDPDSAQVYLVDGKAPPLYGLFRNPDLGRAFQTLQDQGRDGYYKGEIADAIVQKIRSLGGVMSKSDLAGFEAEWVDPISVSYHGYDVFQIPPSTQGFATLEMLNILEQCPSALGLDLASLGPRSATFWHLLLEAKKLAYEDLYRYNGDPRFTDVPLDRLLSKEYAREQCQKIDPNHARTPPSVRTTAGGTVYLTTADRWGNMTSFIYSNYTGFGSGITVPGYGFVLQDRGSLFDLDPNSPNVVEPHKRPFHTLIPGFVMKDGEPVMSFGNMGGNVQPQAQATEIVNMVTLGMNLQAAVDAARFSHDQDSNIAQFESNLYDLVGDELKSMGHDVVSADGGSMGGYQAIHFTPMPYHLSRQQGVALSEPPVAGIYRGASDSRKDGQAVGW